MFEQRPERCKEPSACSSDSAPIELAQESVSRPRIPSRNDIAAYTALAQKVREGGSVSIDTIRTVAEAGFDLYGRLLGDSTVGGAVADLVVRQERVRDALMMLRRLEEMITKLYVAPPREIIQCVASDFEVRILARGANLSGSYAGGVVAAALEETRFMVIFAGRALKSDDHVFGTIAGLKERSFAGEIQQEDRRAPESEERSADNRRAAFEARQAERARKSAEKREALKAGGAVPVERGGLVKRANDEKAELIATSAAQQRGVFGAAKPTEAQRQILRQRTSAEIAKSAGVVDGREQDRVERFRVELTNDVAALLKEWLAVETALRGESLVRGGDIPSAPFDVASAVARERECSREVESLRSVSESIAVDLKRIGTAVLKAKDSPAVCAAFSARMIAAFERLLEPPRSYETYEIAE